MAVEIIGPSGTKAVVDPLGSLSVTGTVSVSNFPATPPLPSGASTAALQTTGNASLSTLASAVSAGAMQTDSVITDEYGFDAENTPMGEIRAVAPVRLVGTAFDGGSLDANFWTSTLANSATTPVTSAELQLISGTNSAGSAKVVSVRRGRYVSGSAMAYRAAITLTDTGLTNNTRIWGVAMATGGAQPGTVSDGAYFKLFGTTFSVVTKKTGVETVVSSGSFNGTLGASYALTTNSTTTFEIYWINTKVWFVVGNMILHTVTAGASPWADSMSHYIYFENTNSGNTTSTGLYSRVASIRRLGPLTTQPISKFQNGAGTVTYKTGPGNLQTLSFISSNNGFNVTLYDNTSATGTILFQTPNIPTGSSMMIDFSGAPFAIGLTLVVVQTGSVVVVYE